jgi:hypothetical protein
VARCVIKTKILKSHSTLEYFIHITLPFSQGKNVFFLLRQEVKLEHFLLCILVFLLLLVTLNPDPITEIM